MPRVTRNSTCGDEKLFRHFKYSATTRPWGQDLA
uniref:Uncharacterized protein n=1 Tax=Anguilla anguilla TaxID=7936 RepID=A0A0E9UYZ4_ANGAN